MSDKKEKLQEKLESYWRLSDRLFGYVGADMYDFEISNYVYFLDNVKSIQDLLAGLDELSPFADDALAIAEKMNEKTFLLFKLDLTCERHGESNNTSHRFASIFIPSQFIQAQLIAQEFKVPLGSSLIRIFELDLSS